MSCQDVIFYPYDTYRHTTRPISEITFYQGHLHFLSLSVLYLPNHVMRQFGFWQRIPVLKPIYGYNLMKWETHSEMYVVVPDEREKIVDGDSLEDGYIRWYEQHSHPRLQNVEHWSGPQKIGTSIGPINLEGFMKKIATIKSKFKDIVESPRMAASKMRERAQEAINIIGDLNQEEEHFEDEEETRPQKKLKVATKSKKKRKGNRRKK